MENDFLPVNHLNVSLPHKSCRFRRHNNLLSKSTHHLSIKGEAVGVVSGGVRACLEKVGRVVAGGGKGGGGLFF